MNLEARDLRMGGWQVGASIEVSSEVKYAFMFLGLRSETRVWGDTRCFPKGTNTF